MATGKVTKEAVDALPVRDRDNFLWDTLVRGFGLKVTPKGARSYVYQYRLGGREAKTRRFTIGVHGSPWTPDAARKEAKRLERSWWIRALILRLWIKSVGGWPWISRFAHTLPASIKVARASAGQNWSKGLFGCMSHRCWATSR